MSCWETMRMGRFATSPRRVEQTTLVGGRGAADLDFNNDGCLDMFLSKILGRGRSSCKTPESANNWLVIRTVGTSSSRDGTGARIPVVTGQTGQIREVSSGSSSMGQDVLAAHFGLGTSNLADSVTIRWPSGKMQTLTPVPANQRITVTERGRAFSQDVVRETSAQDPAQQTTAFSYRCRRALRQAQDERICGFPLVVSSSNYSSAESSTDFETALQDGSDH